MVTMLDPWSSYLSATTGQVKLLCFRAKHFSYTVSLSTQEYK